MSQRYLSCVAVTVLSVPMGATAYQMSTHYDMAREAVNRSVLVQDTAFPTVIGLRGSDEFPSFFGVNSSEAAEAGNGCLHATHYQIPRLIACGAQFEDEGARSLQHFYDPVSLRGLTYGMLEYTNSPLWAVEPTTDIDNQTESFRDARNHYFTALTLSVPTGSPAENKKNRDMYWGRFFQSLGQVIHHLQDMTQPQHVRNDQHLSHPIPGVYNPSLYERYTRDNQGRLAQLMSAATMVPVYGPGGSAEFRVPLDFWKNSAGSGIAEFTNRNFLSAGTNFKIFQGQQVAVTQYPKPAPGPLNPESIAVEAIEPAMPQWVLDYCEGLDCSLTFYRTSEDIQNLRASTRSIFDQYLELRPVQYPGQEGNPSPYGDPYEVDRIFTLNRYNFEAGYGELLPRAVAFSAGMINYFFRGRLELSLPAQGVYSVVDHGVEDGNDPQTGGFSKIKVKVRNVTPVPNQAVEPMSAGKLTAVIKFHRNNCYEADLSGEYGSPGIFWASCRSFDEEIAKSLEVDIPADINGLGGEVEFVFPSKIPIAATALFLQIVYRGRLGFEEDAVVVATKDISEPHYLHNYVRWDQYRYCGAYPVISNDCEASNSMTFAQWCLGGFPTVEACYDAYGMTFKWQYGPTAAYFPGYDPGANPVVAEGQWGPLSSEPAMTPLATMVSPVGKVTRIAVLLDPPTPTNRALNVQEWIDPYHSSLFRWFTGTNAKSTSNQLDPATGTLTPSTTYLFGRGVYLPAEEQINLISGNATVPIPDLVFTSSQITF